MKYFLEFLVFSQNLLMLEFILHRKMEKKYIVSDIIILESKQYWCKIEFLTESLVVNWQTIFIC